MEYFPLSVSQKNILNLEKAFPGTSVNNICATIRMEGELDFERLQESIHLVLERDKTLNIQISEKDGEPVQWHGIYLRENYPIYDFGYGSEESIGQWELAEAHKPISLDGPLYQFALFRAGEGSGGFLIKLHHLLGDGWSTISLCKKIATTYLELLEDKVPVIPEEADYEEYVREEQNYLNSRAYRKDEQYWKKTIEQGGEAALLKAMTSAQISPVGRRKSFELPQQLNFAISRYCEEKRVSPFAVFYMALAVYLRRTGTAKRFTIGVPILNRTNYKWKQTTGMFVTTLPFYNEIQEEWTFDECNEHLRDSWYELLKHQKYPFSNISQMAGGDGRLFHVALSYQDGQFIENRNPDVTFSGKWHYCGYQAEQLTIHMTSLFKNQQYSIDYDYLVQFFGEEEIERLHRNLCEILTSALDNPKKPIFELPIICMEEREQVVYTFNRTDRYVEEMPVYDALIERNRNHFDRTAVICGNRRTSYRQLLCRSTDIARALMKYHPKQEDLIAVLLPREEDLLAAMTASLQIGCAYVVLSDELPVERIRKILSRSGTKIVITNKVNGKRLGDSVSDIVLIEEIKETGTEEFPLTENKAEKEKTLADRLAYVVYTSGSTGEPKGVEITHSNLMNLACEMTDIYGEGAVLSVCNTGFDAFMLESIVALMNGRTIVFPSPEELESPEMLASLMKGYRVGSIHITPSRMGAFMKSPAFCHAARRLESIVCGGEAFPQELLRILKKHTRARIYNQYGPSETTVAVSLKELSGSGKITAGRPMGNCRIYILDGFMNPVPIGSLGHVYIGGICVGRGYRNEKELTDQVFGMNPFVVNEKIYDTGDMGYWMAEGELVLVGRQDDQVKIRGLRVELNEISSCMEAYHGVTSAVAAVCELNGQEVLGAYYCAEKPIDESLLLAHIASYLPKYMVPAFVIYMEQIPVNANGKADMNRLPLPQTAVEIKEERLTSTQKSVLKIFRDVLKTEAIHADGDYFLYGGNSLNAMECIIKIEETMGVRLRVADLYAFRTAVRTAAYLDTNGNTTVHYEKKNRWVKLSPQKKMHDMSPVQQGMYVQSMLDPTGLAYNMPGAFLLKEYPDRKRLQHAFSELLREEPILRTSYRQGPEGICAYVEEKIAFELEELEAEDFEEACQTFVRPFDLGKAPLLRGAVWESADGCYLFLDSHHIAGDGMSTPLLLERLNLAYQEKSFASKWNYYDYLVNASAGKDFVGQKEQMAYWEEHLTDLPEVLKLPGDYSTSKGFDYKGKDFEYQISRQISLACDHFCKEKGISEFVLFLAAYGLLLSEIAGRDDFVIGAPAAGRMDAESRKIIGPFINTLPLRIRLNKKGTVGEWLKYVQETVTGMLDHQQTSLEEIISRLHLPRGQQNALYQVMMTQSPVDESAFSFDGQPMVYRPISTGCVKMDLILDLSRFGKDYRLRFSYARSLFRDETIHFYARCMEQILIGLVENEDASLKSVRVLSAEDYEKYVQNPNEKKIPFETMPVHKVLKKISGKKEEETAIIYHGEEYSFRWLEERAGAIARFIEEKGIKEGTPIGLCLSRTPEMIAAMYGVLKAGCAYVFMLPSFPEARLSYMTEIANAGLVFYDENAFSKMPAEYFEKLVSCKAYPLPEGRNKTYEDREIREDYLVNILFTSGSTGKPKGVMLKHRSISNLYSQMKTLLEPIEGRVLCSTNSVFDCFVVETVIALALGRCVVLADEEEMMLPWKLANLVSTYHTGIFEMTPSRLQMCLGNEVFCQAACHIGIVLLGGEVVTKILMEKFYQHSNGILMNMYGPTEATVFTTMEPLVSGEHITIGRPLQNTRVYVLDEELRPVIPTACGELYIAGDCLSQGYVSRPELNEASFLDDIYYPGEKMYRSGDLVRLRVDGRFDYVGRKDAQVKLNGQRVELGEITGAILESGYAAQAAIVPVKKEDGSMELCAFYEKQEGANRHDQKENIKNHLKKVLPVYMIPSRFIELDYMPMTATNKIDMQMLKERAAEGETGMKEENDSHYILSVWNKVLSHPATDVHTSFFELGGTSMDALNVLSHYYNDHYEMTISQFYDNPTAAMQADILLNSKKKDFVEIKKAALVTGATGFFGIHLTKELLEEGRRVLCLMRDGSRERLKETFEWYFGPEYVESVWDNIQVIKGDIREMHLGMKETDYYNLSRRIDEIYHCAADVRHYAPNAQDYLKTNVDGTKHMLELAKEAGTVFYHMSTCSVSGERLKQTEEKRQYTETDYDIGQDWESNIYVRSKFLAEGLVRKAAGEGVKTKIFRLGRLVGRASDGRFQKNPQTNSFYLHVQGFSRFGVIAEEMKDAPIDLMPIDMAAKEVLALREGQLSVYHIMSHVQPKLIDVLRSVNPDMKEVSSLELNQLFMEKASSLPKEFLPFLIEQKENAGKTAQIEVVNQITAAELKSLGFPMDIPGPEQLLKDFRG